MVIKCLYFYKQHNIITYYNLFISKTYQQIQQMLKSLQFVDPLLAQRIHNLEIELNKLKITKQSIQNNNKLLNGTKEKLIKYHNECEQNTKRMLNQERDKLAEYLDEQTNVISKTNRQNVFRNNSKESSGLNQSTRIDLSIDDSKSIEINAKTQRNCKISSFFASNTVNKQQKNKKTAKASTIKIKNLQNKIKKQSALIKTLINWIKIYHYREQEYQEALNGDSYEQQSLRKENVQLRTKVDRLQYELGMLKKNYNSKASLMLQYQQRYDQLRQQNSSLMLQRKCLLNEVRSSKYNKKGQICRNS